MSVLLVLIVPYRSVVALLLPEIVLSTALENTSGAYLAPPALVVPPDRLTLWKTRQPVLVEQARLAPVVEQLARALLVFMLQHPAWAPLMLNCASYSSGSLRLEVLVLCKALEPERLVLLVHLEDGALLIYRQPRGFRCA